MTEVAGRSWWRAAAWLAFLTPFFFGSYGFATWATSLREHVGSVVFDWEHSIPFVPWTIVPYWSLDVLYGGSLFLCTSRRELSIHVRRLIGVQLVAICCFLLFPLQFTFARPTVGGSFGGLFEVLNSFDKPYNQAPSLHIALVVVVWAVFADHIRSRFGRGAVHVWFLLIALSVLTTWQHHFIDVPTGALLGFAFLWTFPTNGPSPLAPARTPMGGQRHLLGLAYAASAGLAAAVALRVGGASLWLLWLSVALTLVAAAYFGLGVAVFQKRSGRLSLPAAAMLAPYLVLAWLNSRAWTIKHPKPRLVADGVWLGRLPTRGSLKAAHFAAVVDLSAELPVTVNAQVYENLPVLDLTAPDGHTLVDAATAIERLREHGPVLVCCALGLSRSATAVAAWLLLTGRAPSVDAAVVMIRSVQERAVFSLAQRKTLAEFLVLVEAT